MKVDYNESIEDRHLRRKKSVHIDLSPVRHRVLKAQVALNNTSIQAFFEEICGLVCEEDEYIMKILKDLGNLKMQKNKKSKLVKEEKDEIYKYIEEQNIK